MNTDKILHVDAESPPPPNEPSFYQFQIKRMVEFYISNEY